MSAAASIHQLESPSIPSLELEEEAGIEEERKALELLTGPPPAPAKPLIAIDLDDVLSQTNVSVANWHNEIYGTDMKISDFYYYYYWKNPYWGTPGETFQKVKEFYSTDRLYCAYPVPGAREGVETLKDMGFRLVIVTARSEDTADQSWKWVDHYFPGSIENIICTGQFKDAHKTGHEVVTKLSKAEVCDDLGAVLLIDDSAENGLQCATAKKHTPVLLFGDYEWNQRLSGPEDMKEEMTFDLRLKNEGGREFWKEESIPVPEGAPLWRVKDWSEVIRWVKARKAEGKLEAKKVPSSNV